MPDGRSQRMSTRRRHTLSVRVRLMILAVIAIAPLVLERVYNEKLDRIERIEDASKRVLDVARQGTAEQNQVVVSTRVLLQTIANARAEFKFSDGECSDLLAKTAASATGVKTLSVANLQGKIFCSSNPDTVGLDIAGRPHFERAIDTAGFVLGDYFTGTRDQVPRISLALAQRGANDAATAVVIGVLDLSWFEHAAKSFVTGSGHMLMIDGNGTVLAHYPFRPDLVGQNFKDHPLIQGMLAQPEGLITTQSLDGVRRIFGYGQL